MAEDFIEKNLQVIEKAFDTGDLATGGLLLPEQATRFIKDTQKSVVMSKESRVETMGSDKKNIDKIGFGSRILQPAVESSITVTPSEPTTRQVQLSVVEYIAAVDISYSTLEDNIEKARLEQSIMEMVAERVGIDLEELFIQGDTGSMDAFLVTLNGWLKQAGHIVNWNNAVFSFLTVFKAMYLALPKKYLKDGKRSWRFYVHEDLASLYQDEVAAGKYVTADAGWITEDKDRVLAYKGIPVVGVPMMKEGSTGSPAVGTSSAILVMPKNLVEGFHRRITVETWRNQRKRVLEVTLTLRVDTKIEESDAVVAYNNIKHSLT